MMPQHFAVIDRTKMLSFGDLSRMAAALQRQLKEHVSPRWGSTDTVVALQHESDLQPHFVPGFIQDGLDQANALGYHTDDLGQAQAFIDFQGGDVQAICQTISHEFIETKLDYAGSRLVPSWHPVTNDPIRILLEACDPSEALSYLIDGWRMSDFYFQEWFDKDVTPGIPYTFLNAISKPRTILRGGYMSFVDGQGRGWQQTWFRGDRPVIEGPFDWGFDARAGRSVREMVDMQTRIARAA